MKTIKNLIYKLFDWPVPKTAEEVKREQLEEFLKAQKEWLDMYKRE